MKIRTTVVLFCMGMAFHGFGEQLQPAAFQGRLLDTAFAAVSKMPANPHIKNRSRAQLKIATAALTLGQPERTEKYMVKIDYWQRALAYADLACYYADQHDSERATQNLKSAEALVRMADDIRNGTIVATSPNPLVDSLVDWRYESVKARIAQARMAMGNPDPDAVQGVAEDIASRVVSSLAVQASDAAYEKSVADLKQLAAHTNFEVVRDALFGFVALMDKNYAAADRRAQLQAEVEGHLHQLPDFVKIDVLVKLAETIIAHGDSQSGLEIVAQADGILAETQVRPRFLIPPKARLIALRHQAGETEQARAALDELLAYFDAERSLIVDIDRAALLCRMAEVYQQMGATDQAQKLYARAVAEGSENPNARPRADDLAEICCSMALHAVEPSAALWTGLEKMNNGLETPW